MAGAKGCHVTGKVCIVSSCGGHLTEVRELRPAYARYEHFYVLNDTVRVPRDMECRTYVVSHSERDWRFVVNLWQAYRILAREKPRVILTAGAGPAVPFALVGRLLFRTHVIYIETITRVHRPSLTGRLMSHLAHRCFYQWPGLRQYFPKGELGSLLS